MDSTSSPAPDMVLHGGQVLAVDRGFTRARALAVRGERIVAVGDDAAVLALAGPRTVRVDLRGRTVLPGFVDAHAHLDREGLRGLTPSLAGARSIADVQAVVRREAARTPAGEWIVLGPLGAAPYYIDPPATLAEGRYPDRRDLDAAAPDHPVYVRAPWGYWSDRPPFVAIANSLALRRAGVDRDTAAPCSSVEIERDTDGEPTGRLIERYPITVLELTLMRAVPGFTPELRLRAMRESQRLYLAAGVTGVYEGHGVAPEVFALYERLRAEGALWVRSYLARCALWDSCAEAERTLAAWGRGASGDGARPGAGPGQSGAGTGPVAGGRGRSGVAAGANAAGPGPVGGPARAAQRSADAGPLLDAAEGAGDAWLRVGGVFLAPERAAPVADVLRASLPYTCWAGFLEQYYSLDEYHAYCLLAARHGVRVSTIVSGGAAPIVDVWEAVDREVPLAGRRWVMVHGRVLPPDLLPRIQRLGAVVTTVPSIHVYRDGRQVVERGVDGDHLLPHRGLEAAGVPWALSTDNNPYPMLRTLWQAVARTEREAGQVIGAAQRVSRAEALRAATWAGAYCSFAEGERGSLEAGKLADLIVLSGDPLTVPDAALPDLQVELTVVGGRVAHSAGEGLPPADAAIAAALGGE